MLLNSDNIDEMTDTFTTIIKDEIKNVIPSKTVLIRPKDKPGMTGYVRNLFRKCHRFHKIAMKSNSAIDIENHKTARREAKHKWRLAQRIYHEKLCKKWKTR